MGLDYVIPVQAKGRTDRLGIVQIEQDLAVCTQRFPQLICRPMAAQFMADGTIAMFEFSETDEGIRVSAEKHYQLVPPDRIQREDLASYQTISE